MTNKMYTCILQENRTEASSLRQQLLQCQLTSPDLEAFKYPIQQDAAFNNYHHNQILKSVRARQKDDYSELHQDPIDASSSTTNAQDKDDSLIQALFNSGISKQAFLRKQLELDYNIDLRLPNTNEYDKQKLMYSNVYNSNRQPRRSTNRNKYRKVTLFNNKISKIDDHKATPMYLDTLALRPVVSAFPNAQYQPTSSHYSNNKITSSLPSLTNLKMKSLKDRDHSVSQRKDYRTTASDIDLEGVMQSSSRSRRDAGNVPILPIQLQSSTHKYLTAHPSQSSATTIKVPFEADPQYRGSQIYRDLLNSRLQDETNNSSTVPSSLHDVSHDLLP